jgi:hypothetical protein
MSWLSQILGLDKNKSLENDLNAVGKVVLSGVETASPIAASLINVLQTVTEPPKSPITAISDAGTLAAILDPSIVTVIESGLNALLVKYGVPAAAEADIDAFVLGELGKLGIKAPSAETQS